MNVGECGEQKNVKKWAFPRASNYLDDKRKKGRIALVEMKREKKMEK